MSYVSYKVNKWFCTWRRSEIHFLVPHEMRWVEDKQMPQLSVEDLNELQQLDQAARSFVIAASALGQAR